MTTNGFTLVELLVAMGIGVLATAMIILAHRTQTLSATHLESVVATQQNLRASLHHIARDLRMAGADVTGHAYTATVPILTAGANDIVFSWDQDRDGAIAPAEVIRYSLYRSAGLKSQNLGRSEGGARNQPVSQNIEVLDIHYFAQNSTLPLVRPVSAEDRRRIRRVRLTLVARTHTPMKFRRRRDQGPFLNALGEQLMESRRDGYLRLMLSSEVAMRNMGHSHSR